jgi:hypothetical protein
MSAASQKRARRRRNNSGTDKSPLHSRRFLFGGSYEIAFDVALFFDDELDDHKTLTDDDAPFKSPSIMNPIAWHDGVTHPSQAIGDRIECHRA